MPSELEALIAAINIELEAGNWSQVVALSTTLYACAVAEGEALLSCFVRRISLFRRRDAASTLSRYLKGAGETSSVVGRVTV